VIAQVAARQHGVITSLQLRRAGLDRNAIARRVRGGRLHRLTREIYAVGHAGLSDKGQMLAAALACGPLSAITRFHGASLLKVSRFPLPALIDVVAARQRQPSLPVRVHKSRTLVPADVTTRYGIPVTRVPRLLVDFTDVLTPYQVANVIHQAAFRGLFHLPSVRDAMARANGRKLSVLERALSLHLGGSAGTRSTAEDTFLRLIDGALEQPLVNTPLLGEEVDFCWPSRRLVVEVDGPGHYRPGARRDDTRKDAKLRDAGYRVLRVSDADVHSRACYDLICRTYASAVVPGHAAARGR
jgi:hypothetical protein